VRQIIGRVPWIAIISYSPCLTVHPPHHCLDNGSHQQLQIFHRLHGPPACRAAKPSPPRKDKKTTAVLQSVQGPQGQGACCCCCSIVLPPSCQSCQCDRIQPCTACSLHQIADICQYDLSETERQPILQAEALKEKDKTIAHLRNDLALLRGESIKPEPVEHVLPASSNRKLRLPPRAHKRSSVSDEAYSRGLEVGNSIYFGHPGMNNVVHEVGLPSVVSTLLIRCSSPIFLWTKGHQVYLTQCLGEWISQRFKWRPAILFRHCGLPKMTLPRLSSSFRPRRISSST